MQKQERAAENVAINYVGIKSVKKCGKEPVYNMEVDGYHNFSVNGGIIVHNCMDATRYFVNTTEIWRDKKPSKPLYMPIAR